jgi:hypothetical protein
MIDNVPSLLQNQQTVGQQHHAHPALTKPAGNQGPLWMLHGLPSAKENLPNAQFRNRPDDLINHLKRHVQARLAPDVTGYTAAITTVSKIKNNQGQGEQVIPCKV